MWDLLHTTFVCYAYCNANLPDLNSFIFSQRISASSVFCIISQVGLDNFSPCTCSRCSHSCYIILLIQASLVAVLTPHVCGVKLLFNVRTRRVVALNYKLNRHTYNRYTLYIHVYIEKSTAQLASVGLAQACPAQQQMLCSLTHVT